MRKDFSLEMCIVAASVFWDSLCRIDTSFRDCYFLKDTDAKMTQARLASANESSWIKIGKKNEVEVAQYLHRCRCWHVFDCTQYFQDHAPCTLTLMKISDLAKLYDFNLPIS